MTFILYTIAAIALVYTGAVLSGGVPWPTLPHKQDADVAPSDTDALTRDLAAMLAYTGEEDHHEV